MEKYKQEEVNLVQSREYTFFNSRDEVPLLDLNDLKLGKCLGKGGFSKVYSIIGTTANSRSTLSREGKSSSSSLSHLQKVLPLVWNNNKKEKTNSFAIKRLRQSTLREGEYLANIAARDMLNEFKMLSLFNHQNIINIYGYGDDKSILTSTCIAFDHMFLVIDRVECTLNDQVCRWEKQQKHNQMKKNARQNFTNMQNDSCKSLTSEEDIHIDLKVDIALQIAEALLYIHEKGCIYRDLKPQNIGLITVNDASNENASTTNSRIRNKINRKIQVKLFDFGVCRKLLHYVKCHQYDENDDSIDNNNNNADTNYNLSFVGSRRFMAPEVHNKQPYNIKADVYSWSLVLYTMLTLKKPYNEYHDISQLKQSICKNHERPTFDVSHNQTFQVHSDLQTIIKNAWKHNSRERSTIRQVTIQLETYINHAFASNITTTSNTNTTSIDLKSQATVTSESNYSQY